VGADRKVLARAAINWVEEREADKGKEAKRTRVRFSESTRKTERKARVLGELPQSWSSTNRGSGSMT
jgi:hypothetical protein